MFVWYAHYLQEKTPGLLTKIPKAKKPRDAWYQVAKRANWQTFADLRATFASTDQVGRFVVFTIGGNKYRLIAAIHFNRGKLFVRHVRTHADYDKEEWKGD